jgi:hypothetical protein
MQNCAPLILSWSNSTFFLAARTLFLAHLLRARFNYIVAWYDLNFTDGILVSLFFFALRGGKIEAVVHCVGWDSSSIEACRDWQEPEGQSALHSSQQPPPWYGVTLLVFSVFTFVGDSELIIRYFENSYDLCSMSVVNAVTPYSDHKTVPKFIPYPQLSPEQQAVVCIYSCNENDHSLVE